MKGTLPAESQDQIHGRTLIFLDGNAEFTTTLTGLKRVRCYAARRFAALAEVAAAIGLRPAGAVIGPFPPGTLTPPSSISISATILAL